MQRRPERLAEAAFDLLVVGGGISGACLAHDAALRGLSVALIEKDDFGGATSAASSKLLHGGIRYLQTARWDRVRESALERARLQRIAPHLTRLVPFLIPTYPGLLKGRAALTAAVALHEVLCVGQRSVSRDPSWRLPRGEHLSRSRLLELVPALQGAVQPTGARVLYEVHMHSSERMTLAFLKSADRHGAVLANHVELERLVTDGSRVAGAIARDRVSGERVEIRAALTANAAGPWCMALNAQLGIRRLPRTITHFSKGAHIVTRQLHPDFAMALPSSRRSAAIVDRGGRHVFVIPWRGRSLIGTTDSPFQGTPDQVSPDERDIADLLQDVGAALPGLRLQPEDVLHAFAGLYPLSGDVRPEVYRGTGDYQIVDHGGREGLEGFISVIGAKYTTARRLAQRAADLALKKLRREPVGCRTDREPLAGGDIDDLAAYSGSVARQYESHLDRATVEHLLAAYGTEVHAVLASKGRHPTALARLAPDRESVEAEVVYAVEHEMAVHLDDVVFRRTGLGTVGHPGWPCLRRCAGIMGDRLGWSPERRADEVHRTARRFPLQPSAAPHGGR
jgi:glycerol-3-phosphate dehydrogenase